MQLKPLGGEGFGFYRQWHLEAGSRMFFIVARLM
jgi:hypothetical protein